MGDYFDTASQNIDQGKASLLAAIAQHGSQAQAALQSAQDQIAAQKQTAIQQALAAAQQRGAPQAELDQLSNTIGSPYDQRISSLTQSAASRQATSDQTASGAGAYFDQAQAAMPALRTQLAQKVATMQAQAASAQAKAQEQAQAAQLSHDLAAARLANEQAKAQKAPGVGSILNDQFGGQQGFLDYLAGVIPQVQQAAHQDYTGSLSQLRGLGAQGNNVARGEANIMTESVPSGGDIADRVGQAAGLPAGLGSGLYGPYADKQQAAQDKSSKASADSDAYDKGSAFAAQAAARAGAGYTAQTFANDVNSIPGMTPAAAAKVISEYGHLFPNSAAPGYTPPAGAASGNPSVPTKGRI